MTTAEICKGISEKIGPQLQEYGLESFLLVGYVRDGDGKVHKIQLNAHGDNPAYADGLRGMQSAANHWGAGQL